MKRHVVVLCIGVTMALSAMAEKPVVVPQTAAKILERAPIDFPEQGTKRETTVSSVKVLASGKVAKIETRVGGKFGNPKDEAINKSLADSKYAPALDSQGIAIDSMLMVATVFGTSTRTPLSTSSLAKDESMMVKLSDLWRRYVLYEERLLQEADLCENAGSPVKNLKAYILQVNNDERLQVLKLETVLIDALNERHVPDPRAALNSERKAIAEHARKVQTEQNFKSKDPKNDVPGCIEEARGMIDYGVTPFRFDAENIEQFELLMSL